MSTYFNYFILLLFIVNEAICNNNIELFKTTNYTLSKFRDSNFKCNSAQECDFLTLWCKDDPNENCININNEYYDSYNEKLLEKTVKTEPKPILTTCNKYSVEKNKCKTPKCSENSDCYSGLCYSNNCIADKDIYFCEHSLNDVICKKQIYMSCKEDSECLSLICIDETCQPEDYDNYKLKDNVRLGIFIGALLLIILIIYFSCRHQKSKKDKARKI